MRVCRRILIVVAVIAGIAISTFAATPTTLTLNVAGFKRQALVFAPSAASNSGKSPVVFGFHGHGGNLQAAANTMHFQTVWPEAIVVYMQGLPTPSHIDPQGLRPGWQVQSGQEGDRDLKFFDAVLANLHSTFQVDDLRIYVSGFSNGAIFSYFLWAERAGTIAAVGAVAGRLDPSLTLSQPKPLVHVGGRNDQVLPFDLQQQTIDMARQIDAATGSGEPCGPICTLYASAKRTPVMTAIHNGGHIYPPFAPELMVKFFKQYTL